MNAGNGNPNKFLIWGEGGWIAGHLHQLLVKQSKDVSMTRACMNSELEVARILEKVKPTHVINAAGKTGRPNVDWCEDHRQETVRSNVIGTLILADQCDARGIHCSMLATGCIYTSKYNSDHTQLLSKPFTEDDPSNFGGSFYSFSKSRVEDILRTTYPKCLILRIRMPISDDLHPRSFVTKISKYQKIVNIPNSNSILHDLLPVAIAMSEHNETGVYNFTNPGAIGHNEVMAMFREIVDLSKTWEHFTLEEQAKVIKAERSNCELDSGKLMAKVKHYQGEGMDVDVPEIHEAYRRCFERMKAGIQQHAGADSDQCPSNG